MLEMSYVAERCFASLRMTVLRGVIVGTNVGYVNVGYYSIWLVRVRKTTINYSSIRNISKEPWFRS